MLRAAGVETDADEVTPPGARDVDHHRAAGRTAVRHLSAARQPLPHPRLLRCRAAGGAPPRRLASWELLGPLFRSFEVAAGGVTSCMDLPDPSARRLPGGLELMRHQAEVVAAAAAGHRTFLLADEPGLGKTAQALLAAQAANAYPLLVVVPNVVKTNWAREASLWTPRRPATVIHGDGDTIDGFADIVIVNYEVLDRHVGWLGRPRLPRHGRRRGALHQEQDLAALAARARALRAHPVPHRAVRC
ncbi:MAG: SNF2-related protein [Nocardioidaceae bacterium]